MSHSFHFNARPAVAADGGRSRPGPLALPPAADRQAAVGSIAALALLAAAAMITPAAHAALGADVESVARDRAQIKATARTPQAQAKSQAQPGAAGAAGMASASTPAPYTVHEMLTPSGTVVREYAAATGKIFAVTWSGPNVPDLRQLLGASFDAYAAPEAAGPRAHSHRAVTRGDLVVQSSGRMRAFSGKAYLASLVPTGVTIDALQ